MQIIIVQISEIIKTEINQNSTITNLVFKDQSTKGKIKTPLTTMSLPTLSRMLTIPYENHRTNSKEEIVKTIIDHSNSKLLTK